MNVEKVAFVAAPHPEAQAALERLSALYPSVPPEEADVVVALGGDGFMLHTLHDFMDGRKPIFGMNRGSVGFMMNEYREDGLVERLSKAETFKLHPLQMKAYDLDGNKHAALAINEVSLHRETRQAAKIRIFVDGIERMEEMICDGVLVSTAAGSTAYNLSASGPIIPLGAKLLAVTPISAFRPRRWRGALLPSRAAVAFEVLDPDDRRVSATADYTEYRDIRRVEVAEDRSHTPILMFDPEHNLEERVLKEQFSP